MTNKEYDAFLKSHLNDIHKFTKMHRGNFDYDEFFQELLISLYNYMQKNYKPEIQANPSYWFYSVIGFLAQDVYRRMYIGANKRGKHLKTYSMLMDDMDISSSVDYNLSSIIESELNTIEQQIVHSIDYFCSEDGFSYKKVAKKLGITPRVLYYHIYKIRKKLKAAIESDKTS